MSERDSNPLSDDSGNMAPKPRETSGNHNEITHSYFIPVVVLIVLGVTIVSTFYSKEFNNLFAGATPPGEVDEPASEPIQHSLASTQASEKHEDKAKSNTNTEANPVTETSREAATAPVETAVTDLTLTTSDTSSSETTAGPVRADESKNLASSDRKNRAPFPYAPAMSYGMPPQHQQTYNEMMEHRRSLYEEAMQERRQHRMRMREYRAEVLKRVEQDRLDMYKRMQEIQLEHQRRLDQQMNWMELVEKRRVSYPI